MQFNIADYGHTLMSDFLAAGGKFVRMEFHSPAEFASAANSWIWLLASVSLAMTRDRRCVRAFEEAFGARERLSA
jgi:hypothetical protein